MTQQANQAPAAAPQATETSTSGNGVTVLPSLEERSAALFGMPGAPASPESSGDPGGQVAPPADPSGSAAGSVDAAAAARAERRAKLAQLSTEERQRVDTQARHREAAELRRKLDEAEARATASKDYIDPSQLDEAKFFDLAKKLNVTPQKLGEWLRERMTDPEAAAAQAAERAVSPKLSALEQRVQEQQKIIDSFLSNQTAQQQAAEERHYEQQFNAFTTESAATAPYSARFLQQHGPDEYVKLARAAAARVHEGAGAQAILDEVEERLTQLASIYAPQTQQRPAQISQPRAAAQAPTTVSNTLAQTRASIVDEDENWASLPFEERSARVFGRG